MKLGLIKEGKIGPKFVWVENLDESLYIDITSIHGLYKVCRKVGLQGNNLQTVISTVVEEKGGYANLSRKQQELVINQDVPLDRNIGDGKMLFTENNEYVIYQEGKIDFAFNDTNFEKSGTKITCRVYCNGADVLIDGLPISDINKEYKKGNTKFLILYSDPVIQAGFINYFEFEYINHNDIEEIRTRIIAIRDEAAGGASTGVTDWKPNTFYDVGDDVIYNLTLYNCIEVHTSTTEFEREKFEQEGGISQEDAELFVDILSGKTTVESNSSPTDEQAAASDQEVNPPQES